VDYTKLVAVAIICITVLESIALLEGIDGTYLSMTVAAIGAIIGAVIKGYFDRRGEIG